MARNAPAASVADPGSVWQDPSPTVPTFRATDALAFFLLCFPSVLVPEVELPAAELAAAAIVLLATLRRPMSGAWPLWFPVLVALVPLWLGLVGWLNDNPDYRRLGHLALWAALALFIASGRIAIRSAGVGLGLGLLGAVAVSAAGFGSSYPGRLDGWIGDPNTAAFYLTCYGTVALSQIRRTPVRFVLCATLVLALIATWSRTGFAAAVVILLWATLGRTLGRGLGLVALGIATWSIQNLASSFLTWGPFEERAGSDRLRERIILLEHQKLDEELPWYGFGPGSAHVTLAGDNFYFHSSYLGARAEGGLVLLLAVVSLVVLTLAVHLRVMGNQTYSATWAQSALFAPLVMAFTLGEVLLDLPTAVAVGAAMHAVMVRRSAGPGPPGPGAETSVDGAPLLLPSAAPPRIPGSAEVPWG